MWNLKDSNVQIALNIKVNNFKKHLHKLNTTKSNLNKKCITPWQPTFSISRHKNRYHKSKIVDIDKQNAHLLKKIANIQFNTKITTLMDVPLYIPSNKENYLGFKNRERSVRSRKISRENSLILSRINSAEKSYNRERLQKNWQSSRVYINNIGKKFHCYDYRQLATSGIRSKRQTLNSQQLKSRFKQRKQNTQQLDRMNSNSSQINWVTQRPTLKNRKL